MENHHRFLVIQFIWLILGLVVMLYFFPVHGRIDLDLIQPWINPHGQFFLKDHSALKDLAHRYVKYLLILIYSYFLVIFIASYKFKNLEKYRYAFLYFFYYGGFKHRFDWYRQIPIKLCLSVEYDQYYRNYLSLEFPSDARTLFSRRARINWFCFLGWLFYISNL